MLTERSSHHDHPKKCQGCSKSIRPSFHERCDFCQDLRIREDVFCDLNRSVQDPTLFDCHAFQHGLKLVAPSGREPPPKPGKQPSAMSLAKALDSDKFKYRRALSVVGRRSAFSEPEAVISEAIDSITKCREEVVDKWRL